MNLQMTTTQKVVAVFIGMVIITIGLGIVARLIGRHQNENQKCSIDTSQAGGLRDDGITPIAETVCNP